MAAEQTTTIPPVSVLPGAVLAALEALGLPSTDLLEVRLSSKSVTSTYRRRDAEGRLVVAGCEVATVTYVTRVGD